MLESVIIMRNRLFSWIKTGDRTYRQRAIKSGEVTIAGITQQVKKGDLGGKVILSDNPKNALSQRQDLLISNQGAYGSNLWIDNKSVLQGNMNIPRKGLFFNSKLNIANDGPKAIVDNSVLSNCNINTNKNIKLLVNDQSLLHDTKLNIANKTDNVKLALCNHSTLDNVNGKTNSLYINNSNLTNVDTLGKITLNNANLDFDKTQKLTDPNFNNCDINDQNLVSQLNKVKSVDKINELEL